MIKRARAVVVFLAFFLVCGAAHSSTRAVNLRLALEPTDAVTAGVPCRLTLTATGPDNQALTGYEGSVVLSTTDPELGAGLPGQYTFDPAENGRHEFVVTFKSLRSAADDILVNDIEHTAKMTEIQKKRAQLEQGMDKTLVDVEAVRGMENQLEVLDQELSRLYTRTTLHSITATQAETGAKALSEILVFPSLKSGLEMRDEDVRSAISVIVEEAGTNIAMDGEVQGLFSISCQNMHLLDLLKAVLLSKNLEFARKGELIWVYPAPESPLVTKDFILPYVLSARTGRGEISATAGSGTSKSGTSSVNTTTTTDFWTLIENNLGQLLSEDGTYVMNRVAGLIRVTDHAREVDLVEQFLARIEKTALRQVTIKARIMEVQLEKGRSIGMDWAQMANFSDTSMFFGFMRNQVTATGAASLSNYSGSNFKIGIFDNDDTSAVLQALESNGDLKMLSEPTVTTLNNQTAVMKMTVEDVAWERKVEKDTDGNAVDVTYTSEDISLGIILDVTPYVDEKDQVTLSIHPSISDKIGTSTPPGDTSLSKPILSIREMDTVVQLNRGESLVMGGLIKETTQMDETGVPFLMNLPLLGYLFKQEEETTSRNMLLIVVTPYIIQRQSDPDAARLREDLRTNEVMRLFPETSPDALLEIEPLYPVEETAPPIM